ncbi:MAG TPA: peptidoglycan-binding protein, partial [Roseiflexaceae bacterium]|nr:peptidoglycan-binding protein [Roseiflexaceae bacterium]
TRRKDTTMHCTRALASLLLLAIIATVLAACGGTPVPQPSPDNPTAAPATVQPPSADNPTAAPATVQPPAATTPPSPLPTATAPTVPSTQAPQTNAPSPPPFVRTLSRQDPPITGEDVKAAQQRLLTLGYTQVGPADGIYGPNTEAATRAFQTLNQLEVDGILGPRSWERLFSPDATPGAAIVPIVDSDTGWLLGGTYAQRWLNGPTTASLLRSGEQYRRVGPAGEIGPATGERAQSLGIPCEPTFSVDLTPLPPISQTVALGGSWNVLPRVPIEEHIEAESYRRLVADRLRANGIATPDIRLTRVVRADLDGDGSEELLIAASRLGGEGDFPAPSVSASDYSLVVVRTAIGGAEQTIDLVAEYYPKGQEFAAPNRHTLIAIADLNGDGRMEIMVDSKYYEGQSISAYSFTGGQTEEVLSVGCGV